MCGIIIIISFMLLYLFQSRFLAHFISAIDINGTELIWKQQITTVQNRSQTVPSCVLHERKWRNILIFDIQFKYFCILEFSFFWPLFLSIFRANYCVHFHFQPSKKMPIFLHLQEFVINLYRHFHFEHVFLFLSVSRWNWCLMNYYAVFNEFFFSFRNRLITLRYQFKEFGY